MIKIINHRAFEYFNKHIPNYSGWYGSNPIKNYNWDLSYTDPANQAALKAGRVRLSWYDWLMSPLTFTGSIGGFLIPGVVNSITLK
ncbi:MAG: hypothetical protein LBT29_01735 [Flavobacteriaceae bacterium]|jgi:hypothetical protein|nr:hypothetical protein [Flavobacteriaceae bacterium]